MQKQFLVFLFGSLLLNTAFGQKNSDSDNLEAIQHLKKIKNGAVLVVKLPTSAKILELMRQDSIVHQDNARYINRLNLRKKVIIQQNLTYQKNLMTGFSMYYSYSPFIGVYDTTYNKVLDNPSLKGIFYDKNLALVKDYNLAGKDFYTFRLDQVFQSDNKSKATSAFVLTDNKGNTLKYPFPFAIPKKFKKVPILPSNLPNYFLLNTNGKAVEINTKEDQLKYKSMKISRVISAKKLDANYYYAIAKFLQLRLEVFEKYLKL